MEAKIKQLKNVEVLIYNQEVEEDKATDVEKEELYFYIGDDGLEVSVFLFELIEDHIKDIEIAYGIISLKYLNNLGDKFIEIGSKIKNKGNDLFSNLPKDVE